MLSRWVMVRRLACYYIWNFFSHPSVMPMDGKARLFHDLLDMSCMLHRSPKPIHTGGLWWKASQLAMSTFYPIAPCCHASNLHDRHISLHFVPLFFRALFGSISLTFLIYMFLPASQGGDNGVGCFPGVFMGYNGMVLVAHYAWSIWVKKLGWSCLVSCCHCVWRVAEWLSVE